MRCLAFFQNLWVRDPARVNALIDSHGELFRRRLIRDLILGSFTGRRLALTLGDALIAQIDFEEASREIAGNSRVVCRPNDAHILSAIKFYQPSVVVAFGGVAKVAVARLWTGKLLVAPHPAARGVYTLPRLRELAEELASELSTAGNGDLRP